MEKWRDIPSFEDAYQISTYGKIKRKRGVANVKNGVRCVPEKILTPALNTFGYPTVTLSKNGHHYTMVIHRLVAEVFIPNPDNLPCVNHKDEDKTNNHVDNLEWCTYQYNSNWGTNKERMLKNRSGVYKPKPVLQYTLDGEFVTEYPSLSKASESVNGLEGAIRQCCVGKSKKSYGYLWKYKNPSV